MITSFFTLANSQITRIIESGGIKRCTGEGREFWKIKTSNSKIGMKKKNRMK